MFDSFIDVMRNLLEPLGDLGRTAVLVVGAALLIASVITLLIRIGRGDVKGIITFAIISIALGVISYGGFQAFKTLGEQGGQDFESQFNAIQLAVLPVVYTLYSKYKKKHNQFKN